MLDMEEFGERIKNLRGNESRESFGRKYGKTAGWVGHLETGKREPQVNFLLQMSNDYGVSVDYLLKGEDLSVDNIHLPLKIIMSRFCLTLKRIQEDLDLAESHFKKEVINAA